MRFAATRAAVLGLSLVFVPHAQASQVPSPGVPVTPASAPDVPAVVMPGRTIDPTAETAYREGQSLMQQGKFTDAVIKFDDAIRSEPNWAAPVKLRADAFGALAERYAPSEAFLVAQAEDLERLTQLEPGVDAAARLQKLLELRRAAADAKKKESRRRKLGKPAVIYIALNISMLISGALMTSFLPSTASIDSFRAKRYVYTGAVMLGIGGAMIPGSIALGVLAGRQSKRDSAVADFYVESGRTRPVVRLAPQFLPGGGGLGLNMRF